MDRRRDNDMNLLKLMSSKQVTLLASMVLVAAAEIVDIECLAANALFQINNGIISFNEG